MANFLYRTKHNCPAQGKPRVYFTCHPEDFGRSFNRICEDIFRFQDCAIYYTENMVQPISEEDKETDLGRMNLFVIPVSLKLLIKPNRAMDEDFAYARKCHIPVLPILLEPGLDTIYSRSDRFGELQYLDPNGIDRTAIAYEEKLKKYLKSVLVGNETAARIRAAFDAYIFLSYRKKDRKYANELMRLIHRKPELRDIAIWYDEFLTPGESFRENIRRMIADSKLFALLVTPSLLEEPEGQPNFIISEEYPEAKNAGMDILPAEMVPTDRTALEEKFSQIPECVDPNDDEAFRQRLLGTIQRIAVSENDDAPEHNFLIGLAYLDGIDVEIDRERGLELITKAAEAELEEAMDKLYNMYYHEIGVPFDYHKAVYWCKKLMDYRTRELGPEHPDTLTSLHNLACTYERNPDSDHMSNDPECGTEARMELLKKVYTLRCKVLGREHLDTLATLTNLAPYYCDFDFSHGYRPDAVMKNVEFMERIYAHQCKFLGPEHTITITSLYNLAAVYFLCYGDEKASELCVKVCELSWKAQGFEHPVTQKALELLWHCFPYDREKVDAMLSDIRSKINSN